MSLLEDFDKEVGSQEQETSKKTFWLQILDESMKEFKQFLVTSLNQMTNSLKKAVFKVELTNQEKIVFPKSFEVSNQKDFPKDIRVNNLSDIKIPETKINIPESVIVKNFPEYPKFPEIKIPKSVEVSNMGDIVKQIAKFADRPVKVTVKQGMFDKTPKVTVNTDNSELVTHIQALQEAFKALADRKYPETDISPIVEAVDKVTYSLDSLEFPVPVFNHTPIVEAIEKIPGGGGGGYEVVGVKDVSDVRINPATEETLNAVATAVDGLEATTQTCSDELQSIDDSTSTMAQLLAAGATSDNQDPLARYKFADIDDAGAVKYYGAIDKDGQWYILKSDTTNKTLRYAAGSSSYPTAWTGRASQTYQYFNEAF